MDEIGFEASAGRAGLKAYVLIPKGAVALGKLSQSVMHGARVLEVIEAEVIEAKA